MRRQARIIAVLPLTVCSMTTAQDDPTIVVEGERLKIASGLWRVQSSPGRWTIKGGGPTGKRQLVNYPGWHQQLCIPSEGLEDAVRRLIGDSPDQPDQLGCSRLHVRIDRDRLTARKSCAKGGEGGTVEASTIYRGSLRPGSFDVSVDTRTVRGDDEIGGGTHRISGERVGLCPLSTGHQSPARSASNDSPPVRSFDGKLPSQPGNTTPDLKFPPRTVATPPPVAAASSPTATASAENIVVVGRKLRRLRLRYRSSGRTLASCHPEISSGEPRLDRIGCAILRSCIREGAEDEDHALECFRRKVDELDPD